MTTHDIIWLVLRVICLIALTKEITGFSYNLFKFVKEKDVANQRRIVRMLQLQSWIITLVVVGFYLLHAY